MSGLDWVLDSGALVAYARGVDTVGQVLVDVADAGGTVAIPLICLLEAYSLLHREEHALLKMLRRNPVVRTVVPTTDLDGLDDCPFIGAIATHTGRLGAAHAAYVALVHVAGVVTTRPDQIRAALGDKWEIIDV